MKFKLPFRSSRRSFHLSNSDTAIDTVPTREHSGPRPSYRLFDPIPDFRLSTTSQDNALQSLSSTTPRPSDPPPLPLTPPPTEQRQTSLIITKEPIPEAGDVEQKDAILTMGCVASEVQEKDVETGEKEPPLKCNKPTIHVPTSEDFPLRLNGAKKKSNELKETNEDDHNDNNYNNELSKQTSEQSTIIEVESHKEDAVKENIEEKRDRRKSEEKVTRKSEEKEDGDEGKEEKEDAVESEDDQLEELPNVKKVGVSAESPALTYEKKEGVSAESSQSKVGSSKEITIVKYEKDEASVQLIKKAFLENQFLNFGLDSDELIHAVVDAMFIKNFPAGSYVIREGESGSELYVSAKGIFDVFKGTKKVNTLIPGHVFGELAVLYNSKRNASILATSDCSVWVLDRKVFHRIMMKAGLRRQEENIKFLRSVPLLRILDRADLIKMSDLLKLEFFEPGRAIIKQGDEGSTFYIITLGKVRVSIKQPDGDNLEVGVLTKGDFFGERALINDDKRKATCTAITNCECLVLDRGPFMDLLGSLDVLQNAAGKRKADVPAVETKTVSEYEHIQLDDLVFLGTLGIGGFGRVELVRSKKETGSTFALKCLKKKHISEQQQREHTFNEKNIMLSCRSPFIARLYKTFRDNKFLYLLMEPCMGGDVWTLLQKFRVFDENTSRFMTGCVVEGLEYLHTRGIVYRDLKPENLMLDNKGYVKIVDFGFAKKIGHDSKTWTFAGTPEYLPPEIIRNKGHDRAADYWSLGIFIYELLAGRPPFRGADHIKTYRLIVKGIDSVHFPITITRPAEILIRKLCRPVPTDRVGYQKDGVMGIKTQRWFQNFDWAALQATQMPAPNIPKVKGPEDLSNFERYPRDKEIPPDDTSGWDNDF